MEYSQFLKFTDSHEWILIDGDQGKVGISEYAQGELGEVVHVELPSIGKQVRAGQEVAVIESTKAASDVYMPVSGIIISVNRELLECPALINADPEGRGWLFTLFVKDASELDTLFNHPQYLQMISQ